MKTLRAAVTLLLLPLAASATHDGISERTRFLVPILARNVPGAFGSLWTAETWFHYAGATDAFMLPTPFCIAIQCPDGMIVEPGLAPMPVEHVVPGQIGLLVHVDRAHADEFAFSSRVRDLSRAATGAGTAIPVVREEAMHTERLRLLNVPVGRLFRNTLRIYGLPELPAGEVEVRYYQMPGFGDGSVDLRVVLLRTERVILRDSPLNDNRRRLGQPLVFPLIGEVANLDAFVELPAGSAVWIEVVPVTPGLRLWAMISITNNETQQVTIVTP